MAEIPLLWRTYAAQQSNLSNRTCVDPISWGIEDGLNHLLVAENVGDESANIDRIVASGARRHRYARSLLAKYIIVRTEVHDDTNRLEARSHLAALKREMPVDKFGMLIELAAGSAPSHLAEKHEVPPTTLRTRISRSRELARRLAT